METSFHFLFLWKAWTIRITLVHKSRREFGMIWSGFVKVDCYFWKVPHSRTFCMKKSHADNSRLGGFSAWEHQTLRYKLAFSTQKAFLNEAFSENKNTHLLYHFKYKNSRLDLCMSIIKICYHKKWFLLNNVDFTYVRTNCKNQFQFLFHNEIYECS